MDTTDPPWEPPLAGSEAEHLAGALDRLRWTFRWKCDGLDRDALTATVGSSTLTLGGLLKHLAVCEDVTFSWKLAGEPPVAWLASPEGADEQWQMSVTAEDTPESLYAMWDEAVERSRDRFASSLEKGLDQEAHLTFDDGQHVSMRRIVFDLVEEYGRHTGHADLLREAVDGRVGEDPPHGWRPTSGAA
ncbi:MAG: DinB family protein [Arachnia sp.]